MSIYTFLRGQSEPEKVAEEWFQVIELGWVFIGLTKTKTALMTRNGYINEFWEIEEVR